MKPLNSAVRTAFYSALTAVSLTAYLPAQTASIGDLEALREQIRLLDQKLRVLERYTELKDEAAAAKKQPKLTVGDNRIEVVSANFEVVGRVAQLNVDNDVPNGTNTTALASSTGTSAKATKVTAFGSRP